MNALKQNDSLHQQFSVNLTIPIPSDSILISKVQYDELLKQNNLSHDKEWMNLKEAAAYACVSYNTFIKFRDRGLKICEVEGVKRVSKKEVDHFLERFSF